MSWLSDSSTGVNTVNSRSECHGAGGSSSGSAVAVAAGLAPVALGSDTGRVHTGAGLVQRGRRDAPNDRPRIDAWDGRTRVDAEHRVRSPVASMMPRSCWKCWRVSDGTNLRDGWKASGSVCSYCPTVRWNGTAQSRCLLYSTMHSLVCALLGNALCAGRQRRRCNSGRLNVLPVQQFGELSVSSSQLFIILLLILAHRL